MLKRKLLILISCVVIATVFAACGDAGKVVSDAGSKVGDTMSDIGRDESGMMSRVESFMDGDNDKGKDTDKDKHTDDGRTESDTLPEDDSGEVESGYPLIDDSSSKPESDTSKLS